MENCKAPDKSNALEPERWARIESAYHGALALDPGARPTYLNQVCAGDDDLRREIESLLGHAGAKLANPYLDLQSKTITQNRALGSWRAGEDTNLLSRKPFHPGQLVDNRFEIIREIGEGGMGVVYEAFDSLRHVRIAIKASKPDFQRFLSPELEGALKVRHPNVCLVNQIHTANDIDFLTMELLEGETLSAVIARRGRLPLEEARVIALQLWSGLNQAHRSGVIHRDLKAANVILCGLGESQPRAVITDFGLCGEAHQTGIFGTLRYMSPELKVGQKGAKASDIYALGIILYEMVTGINRDEAPSDLQGASFKRTDPYYQLVGDFLSIHPETRCRAFAGAPARLSRRATSRRQMLAIAAGGVAAVVGGTWVEKDQIQNWLYPLPKRRFVALLAWPPGIDMQERGLVEGAIDAIESELARQESADHDLFVISASHAVVDTGDVHWLSKLAEALGVNMVLQISSFQAATQIGLLLKLLDVSTGSALRQRQINDSPSDIASLSNRAVEAAAHLLNVRWDEADAGRLNRGAPSPAALEAFQQAGVFRNKLNDDGLEPAIELYKKAIEADPQYAAAYAKLASAYLRSFALTKDLGVLELVRLNAEKALQLDSKSDLAHLALAKFYDGHNDLPRAQAEIQLALQINPSNATTLLWLSQIFTHFRRWSQAEQTLLQLKRERPNYWLVYNQLGLLYMNTDRPQDAIQAFRVAAAAAPGSLIAAANLGSLYFRLDQLSPAEEYFRRSLTLKPTAECYANLAEVLRIRGKFAEGVEAASMAAKLKPSDDETWFYLADCLEAIGDREAETQDSFRKALQAAEPRLQADPDSGPLCIRLALYMMKLHSTKEVWQLVKRSEEHGQLDVESTLIKARVFELAARRTEALDVVALCLRRGMLRFQVDTTRDLRGLKTDPRYSRILKTVV